MTKTNKMFRAEDELWEEFKEICEQQNRTRGEVLRESMEEYINTFKKEEKEMKIIDIVELNENGVNVEKEDNPMAVKYFNDNGGEPNGNFDENDIAGEWVHLEGKHTEFDVYAYRTIDDSTLVPADIFKETLIIAL